MPAVASRPSEMAFFSLLARCGSFSRAAGELGLSTPAVSKRLAQMEARLGVQLLNRTTRRASLTPEGENYLQYARRILVDIEDMERLVSNAVAAPQGLLRVNSTLGFGRSHVAPLISRFVKAHPQVQVELQLTVNPPPLSDDVFDLCIRFGEPPVARVVALKLAPTRLLLVAAPAYLPRHNPPTSPQQLTQHNFHSPGPRNDVSIARAPRPAPARLLPCAPSPRCAPVAPPTPTPPR